MELKQVIIIRQDLKLPKGKACAQAAHASVTALEKADISKVAEWKISGQKKIVLKVKDEKELIKIFQTAKDQGITTSLITDAGRTCIAPGTKTAVAIGPDEEEVIDNITGELSML